MKPRPLWHWLVIIAAVWVVNAFLVLRKAEIAVPISVLIPQLDDKSTLLLSARIIGLQETPIEAPLDNRAWTMGGSWIRDIDVRATVAGMQKLETFDVMIGKETYRVPVDQVLRETAARGVWISRDDPQPVTIRLAPLIRSPRSHFFWLKDIVNWPGDKGFLMLTLLPFVYSLGGLVAIVLLFHLAMWSTRISAWVHRGLGTEMPAEPDLAGEAAVTSRLWMVTGLSILLVSVCLLEIMQPCYFTQDDNHSQFLPVQLQACRSLEGGLFPTWDPCQSLGVPTTSLGNYALTYPPTYVAHIIARTLLADENQMMEVYAMLHLAAGFVAAFWLFRLAGMRASLAMAGGLAFVLSGYFLIVGRGWCYMLPITVWLPLLAISAIRLRNGPVSWRWVVGTGLVIGLAYHAGNVQMLIYGMMFFFLAVAVWVLSSVIPFRRSLWTIPASLLGVGLAAPVLYAQFKVTAAVARDGGRGECISLQNLWAMVAPYPLSHPTPPWTPGAPFRELSSQLYYSGTLFVSACFLFGIVVCFLVIAFRWDRSLIRRVVAENAWMICAGVALWIGLGNQGLLWTWMSKLPGFNKFNHSFKFLPFVTFFCVLGGGVVIERYLARFRRPKKWELVLAILVAGLMIYHATLSRISFYTFYDRPYPALPKELAELIVPGTNQFPQRVVSISPNRSPARGYVESMNHNWPSAYGVLSVKGYDMVGDLPENRAALERMSKTPLEAMRAYGVRWILVHKLSVKSELSENPLNNGSEVMKPEQLEFWQKLEPQAKPKLALDNLFVFELTHTAPLAFAVAAPDEPLPIQFHTVGAAVHVNQLPQGGKVVINVLWRPEMIGMADRRALPLQADEWGRIVIDAPAGAKVVEVWYQPPWGKGIMAGIFLGILAFAGVFGLNKWVKPEPTDIPEPTPVSEVPVPAGEIVETGVATEPSEASEGGETPA